MKKGRAIRLLSELQDGGRSRPLLLEVELEGGEYIDVVAKLACDGVSLGPARLLRECAAAALAEQLGLPVPERFLVEISSLFIDSVADVSPGLAARLRVHCGLAGQSAFGTSYLHGFGVVSSQLRLEGDALQCAAEIFAFDALSLNRDRCVPSVGNPNCLFDGRRLVMIDHEQALDAEYLLSDRSNAPWTPGALRDMTEMLEHIFAHGLQGKPLDLARLKHQWAQVDDFAALFVGAVAEWDPEGGERNGIEAYLTELALHLDGAFTEVKRVLA